MVILACLHALKSASPFLLTVYPKKSLFSIKAIKYMKLN